MTTTPKPEPNGNGGKQAENGQPNCAQSISFSGATAWAGSELVNFQQAGRGKPVLLLSAGQDSGTEARLATALAGRFRVVLPSMGMPNGTTNGNGQSNAASVAFPVGETLELFLDTLGFARVTLVATPPYASAALAYALLDAERVERLVIFIDDRLRNGSSQPLISDRLSEAGIPLAALAWPDSQPQELRESCVAAIIDEVTSFLS